MRSHRFAVVAIVLVLAALVVGGVRWSQRQETPARVEEPGAGEAADSLSRQAIDQLRSLPYVSWQAVEETDSPEDGVTVFDRARAFSGLNLYNVDGDAEAHLIDMTGRQVHSWQGSSDGWHHVEIGTQGVLRVVVQDEQLLELDWNSNVQWSRAGRFHHDLTAGPDGRLYALMRERRDIPYADRHVPILDDYVAVLSAQGETERTISLWDLLGERVPEEQLEAIDRYLRSHETVGEIETYDSLGVLCDVFHANSIAWIDHEVPGVCHRGDLLLSVRQLNLIAVLDLDQMSVTWSWGADQLWRQHHATLLPSGRILLFDNRKLRQGSRAVESDPRLGDVV